MNNYLCFEIYDKIKQAVIDATCLTTEEYILIVAENPILSVTKQAAWIAICQELRNV